MLNSKLDVITEAYYKDFKEKKTDELWVIEDLDFTDEEGDESPLEDMNFKKWLKDHQIKITNLNPNGPGGGNPNADFVGPKAALEEMVMKFFGGKDNDSGDVIECYLKDPELFHPYKKAIKEEKKPLKLSGKFHIPKETKDIRIHVAGSHQFSAGEVIEILDGYDIHAMDLNAEGLTGQSDEIIATSKTPFVLADVKKVMDRESDDDFDEKDTDPRRHQKDE